MLLGAFLPVMPASAATSTLGISITEHMGRGDTYTPALPTGGSTTTTTAFGGDGTITIRNNLAATDLYNVIVVFNQGSTTTPWSAPAGVTLQYNTPAPGQITATIPKLARATSVDITYTVASGATLPLYLTASYSQNKVNVGGYTDATLTLNRDTTVIGNSINSVSVRLTPKNLDGDGVPDWVFSSLAPGAGTITDNGDGSFTWNVGTVAAGTGAGPTLSFRSTENDAGAHDGATDLTLYDMADSSISYSVTTSPTTAGVSIIGSPRAITTGLSVDLAKEQLSGNAWQFTPKITNTNTADVTFTLESVSFYATDSGNLSANIPGAARTVTAGSPWALPHDLDRSAVWTATPFSFTYNGVPAGFIKPSFTVKDDSTQMPKSYSSLQGAAGITLLKKIYVMNGYNIEVVKTITDLGSGVYQIHIDVTNTGSKASPDTVLVYDIVPSAFSAHDFNPATTGDGAVTSPVTGHAYWWNVGPLASHQTKTIIYQVTGSGAYPLNDIFLIGVDPAQSMSLQSTPALNNVSAMASANFEALAALGAVCLIAVGMVGTARRRL